ncbi:O-antigen ligase family protein [Methylobacterium oryzisoli]|uniref:O-antigen ligase family protein n=1 Tax=Methylobacterium oryzisoli TaxID=3385502 RepID=UPI0038912F8B
MPEALRLPAAGAPVRGLAGIGAFLLAALPACMAAANRSSPLVVGVAGLAFLAAALAAEGRAAGAALLRPLVTPPGLAVLAFLGWCALSLAWTPLPALWWRTASEFLPALAAAYLVARLAPPHLGAVLTPALWLLVATGAYVVADIAADLIVQRVLGLRVADFVFNRTAVTILVVMIPLAACAWVRGRRGLALAGLLAGAAAVTQAASAASLLGLAVAAFTYGIARLLPRTGFALAGLGLLVALALSPVEGDLLARAMPEALHQRLAGSSSHARVAIARSFGAAVAEDPWRGAGFGTSGRFEAVPAAERLEPDFRALLAVGHPHNSFLQVWAELGLVGTCLAATVIALGLRALAAWPPPARAAALALIAGAAAVAFVGHGAWQGWWIASLGAAVAWLRAMRHSPGQ